MVGANSWRPCAGAHSMNNAPDPMVPAEVDLRDFAFMPLDVVRLRDSGLAAKATGDEFRAAVLLWCASWHQVPAASLPDDDAELANLCGYGRALREWKRIREGALRGWVKCTDGRLYHETVGAKAREAWQSKLAQRARTEAARKAREEARQRLSQEQSQRLSQSLRMSVTETVTESKGQGQGQGQGTPIPPSPHRGRVHEFPPGFEAFWQAYPRKTAKPAAAKAFARLKPDERLLQAMLAAVREQTASEQWAKDGGQFIPHPATWLNGRRWEDRIEPIRHASGDVFEGVH